MDDQQTPRKKYTVGALLLHTVVLLGFAAISYVDSLTYTGTGSLTGGLARLASVFYGALGMIAVWLTGQHYTETVNKKNLQTWAAIHIALSIYALIMVLISYITYPSIYFLVSLLPVLLFLLPPVLVAIFAGKERT